MPDLQGHNDFNSLLDANRDSLSLVKLGEQPTQEVVEPELKGIELIESVPYGVPVKTTTDFPLSSWIFGLFALIFIVLAVLKVRQPNKFGFLTTSFFQGRSVIQPFKEGLIITSASSIVMLINFFLMMGLLLYYVAVHFGAQIEIHPVATIGIAVGVVTIAYLVKLFVSSVTQLVVGIDGGLTEYRYNVIFFCQNTGLILLPLMLTLSYVDVVYRPIALYVCLSILGLMYIFRFVKTIIIGVRESVPWLYLFLYLCTLEILPLVVITKLLIGRILGLD